MPQISVDQFMQQRSPQSPSTAVTAPPGANGASVDDFMRSRSPQPIPGAQDEPRTFMGGVRNLVSSTGNLISGVANMAAHPLDTLSGINELGWGAAEKLSPGVRQSITGQAEQASNPFDELWSNLKQRYGGVDNILKTAYKDPAGMMADIAAVASGAGGVMEGAGKTMGLASRTAATGARLASTGAKVAEAARYADPINLVAKGVSSVGAPIMRGAGKLASEGLGLTTGVGGETIRTAFSRPTDTFKTFLRGDGDISDVVNAAKQAVTDLKNQRGAAYRADLAALPKMNLDASPVLQKLSDELDNFGVQLVRHPKKGGGFTIVPDFNGPLNKIGATGAQQEVRKVVRQILDQPIKSGSAITDIPSEHLDALKQRLDSLYSESSEARKLTASVRSSVRDVLSQVPGYDKMTGSYENATQFLNQVIPELSLSAKTNPGTAARKLNLALNQNMEWRQSLIDAMDTKTGSELRDMIAGHALNQWAPRGLMRTVAGGSLLYGMGRALNPVRLLEASLASPRAIGELVSGAGEAARGLKSTGGAIRKVAAPGVYRPLMMAAHPDTGSPAPPPAQEYDYVPGRGLVPRQ